MQVALTPQALPHVPQFAMSVNRLASQPSLQEPLQLPQFGLQVQVPETQVALTPQALPQAPQCRGLDWRFCSQPSAGLPLQSPSPGGQEQTPSPQPAPGAQRFRSGRSCWDPWRGRRGRRAQ